MDFDDKDKFEPLGLNCAVKEANDSTSNKGKLTTLVTYHTRYKLINKLPILLSFGLGKEVTANAITVKPTLKEWTRCVEFSRDVFTSEELRLSFDMSYKMANLGLPKDVIFDSTSFVRPK